MTRPTACASIADGLPSGEGAERAKAGGPRVLSLARSEPATRRKLSDIDFWLESRAYNVVECVHMVWLMTVVDMLVGKAEYAVA